MAKILYLRCSSASQSVESQRSAMMHVGPFDREFVDEGVSGSVLAAARPGFSALLSFVREGDQLYFWALDRCGRDALDVQSTIRNLLDRGVDVHVNGLGQIGRGVGEIVLAVVAQIADLERQKIIDRCESGRAAARASLAETGRTHRGKISLGRPASTDASAVKKWRTDNAASISTTAAHFKISAATVKRCMK